MWYLAIVSGKINPTINPTLLRFTMGSMRLRTPPDTWELRLYLGRDTTGRVRHKHTTFVGSKRAAERELARLSLELESSSQPSPDESTLWGAKTTFNDAILAWKQNGWQDLSPKTVTDYESLCRLHIKEKVGRKPIAKIGVFELEAYFRSLSDAGLGTSGIRQVRAILHKAARLAGKWSGGVIPNPVSLADLPKFSSKRVPVRSPTLEEVRRILQTAEERSNIQIATMIRLIAATGMRRGEAAALRWSDISFQSQEIIVDESVIGTQGTLIVKSPKTSGSLRTVTVDKETVRALESLRDSQLAIAQSCGFALGDDAFVFSYSPDGLVPPHPDSISHGFKKVVKLSGVASDIHLHSLRHFQATAIDPLVSERQKQARLGWSTSHMARHYTDPITEEDRKVAAEIGEMLDG